MANAQVSQLLIQIYIHIPTPLIQCCNSKCRNSQRNELNSYQHCSGGRGEGAGAALLGHVKIFKNVVNSTFVPTNLSTIVVR